MKEAIVLYVPWALSILTIWTAFLAGNKTKAAWQIGIAAQALWLLWIILSETWGMIPGNIALWIVYTRNYYKWAAE